MTRPPNDMRGEGTVLTRGLRRVLWGALAAAFFLAATQIAAVDQLRKQIDHWDWITEIDGQRERLLGVTQENLDDPLGVPASAVFAAFDQLGETIAAHAPGGSQAKVAREFLSLKSEARAHYSAALDRERAMEPYLSNITGALDTLQRSATGWAAELTDAQREILARSERNDAEHRAVSARKDALIRKMIAVQNVQQQIIAIQRLSLSGTETALRAFIAGLELDALPRPCTIQEINAGTRLCQPNIARVQQALVTLQSVDFGDVPDAIRQSLWALEAFNRAANDLIGAMAEEELRALDAATAARERITELGSSTTALTRINRAILDMETLVGSPLDTSDALGRANSRGVSLISQLKLRLPGFLDRVPFAADFDNDLLPLVDTIADQWSGLIEIATERLAHLAAFRSVTDRLTSDIAAHSTQVQRDTMLWVGVYSTTFMILALFLGASVLWLASRARSRFVAPLSQVTDTLLELSRGDLGQPFIVQEKAFGFDQLGEAVEQLRLEMVERQALALKTEEQRRTIAHNLAELARTSEEMQWLAMHDTLTGLGNRRKADSNLAELDDPEGSEGADFCIMQVDIDRFKDVNDTLGHAAGDFVLKSVAEILFDVTSRHANCYRVGGDEFLVVIRASLSNADAAEIATALIARISEPMGFDDHICRVGASIGIAFGRDAGFVAAQTMSNADLALYQTKQNDKGGYGFFTEELANRSRRRKDLSDRILAAIEARAFQPHYQPQFYAKGLALRGVEVLCRWHDPDHGWIPPGQFLDAAEELGVVGLIDEILFEKAAQDVATLREQGLAIPRISFNVTLDRLLRADLAHRLNEQVGDGVTIALELLESLSLDNPTDAVAWAIDMLKESGIEIEIDDFGSYRASLAGLMAVNPGAMKIDRQIVMPITQSPRHLNLVKKIIDIGAALNIEVVAEGVESDDHATTLEALGCGVLQGFGLARPMPFDRLAAFCQAREECQVSRRAIA